MCAKSLGKNANSFKNAKQTKKGRKISSKFKLKTARLKMSNNIYFLSTPLKMPKTRPIMTYMPISIL